MPTLDCLGLLIWVSGLVMLVPMPVELWSWRPGCEIARVTGFGIPAAITFAAGILLKRNLRFEMLP